MGSDSQDKKFHKRPKFPSFEKHCGDPQINQKLCTFSQNTENPTAYFPNEPNLINLRNVRDH